MRLLTFFLGMVLAVAPAFARSHSGSSRSSRSSASHSSHSRGSTTRSSRGYSARQSSTRCISCQRDSHGRIKRSAAARDEFKHSNPCPATGRSFGACPGYVIDHVQALKHGGSDTPSNMQWQTKEAAKAKDRVE